MKTISLPFKIGWQRIVLLVLMAAILVPSLFVKWMIIDDGVSVRFSQQISHLLINFDFQGLSNLFAEQVSGRYRPMYWLFYWASFVIVGKSALGYHLIQSIAVGISVYVLFLIINLLTASKNVALIGSLLFLLTSLNIDNWYRLGTAEPKFTFFLGLSIYFLLKIIIPQKFPRQSNLTFMFSVITLGMAFFTKETSIALFPFVVLLLLGRFWIKGKTRKQKWSKYTLYFFLANLTLLSISIIINIFVKPPGGYSAHYLFSIPDSISAARGYLQLMQESFGMFPQILLISFFIFYLQSLKRKKLSFEQYLQLTFIIGGTCFLAVLLPWSFVLGRYLEPTLFFLIIAFSFEFVRILKFLQRFSKPVILMMAIVLFGSFLYSNLAPMFNFISDTILGSRMIAATLEEAAREVKPGGNIFMNLKNEEATTELVFESGLHLNVLYNHPDLKVDYLDENNLTRLKQGDIIVSAFSGSSFVNYPAEILLQDNRLQVNWVRYHRVPSLFISAPSLQMVLSSIRWRRPLDLHNHLQYNITENSWMIYQVI